MFLQERYIVYDPDRAQASLPDAAALCCGYAHRFPGLTDCEIQAIRTALANPTSGLRRPPDVKMATKSSDDRHLTYLRVGIGLAALGEITAVLELWPTNHASPKHQHGGCAGSVRLLSGSVVVEIYDNLYDADADPLIRTTLQAPQTTWMDRQNFFCHRVSSRKENDGLAISLHVYKSCIDEFAFESSKGGAILHKNPKNDFFWNIDLPSDDPRVQEDVPDFLNAINIDVTHDVNAILQEPDGVHRLLVRAKERINSTAD